MQLNYLLQFELTLTYHGVKFVNGLQGHIECLVKGLIDWIYWAIRVGFLMDSVHLLTELEMIFVNFLRKIIILLLYCINFGKLLIQVNFCLILDLACFLESIIMVPLSSGSFSLIIDTLLN